MRYKSIYNYPKERMGIVYPWVYWDDGFSKEEMRRLIDYCEDGEMKPGTTLAAKEDKQNVNEQYRRSKIRFIDVKEDNRWIFSKFNNIIESINSRFYCYDLNGYNYIQYTTYDASEDGHYDWHIDYSMGRYREEQIEPRKLSMTMELNDDFEGGEFEINQGKPEVLPTKPGRAIFFPSFLMHRVNPVTKGTRKSLVIWVHGPQFI